MAPSPIPPHAPLHRNAALRDRLKSIACQMPVSARLGSRCWWVSLDFLFRDKISQKSKLTNTLALDSTLSPTTKQLSAINLTLIRGKPHRHKMKDSAKQDKDSNVVGKRASARHRRKIFRRQPETHSASQ